MLKSFAVVLMSSGVAQAAGCTGASLRFVESAPRDQFELVIGADALQALSVDLRGSQGWLIFDTASGGRGVEVFQPLRDEGGVTAGDVADGTEMLRVVLKDGQVGARGAFSIDVDDRLTGSDLGQIRVKGGEMAGTTALFELADGQTVKAVFDTENCAQICS